jgi:hypothetical protein
MRGSDEMMREKLFENRAELHRKKTKNPVDSSLEHEHELRNERKTERGKFSIEHAGLRVYDTIYACR